jgi:UDP-glucose 4-epimerase
MRGTAFTLNGNDYNTPDCTCIRDYVHVWDLADAHIRAAEWALGQNTRPAAVFNLGTRHGISNQEIIDYVQAKYGAFEIKLGARRAGDPDCLVADAELAYQILQWKPNYSTIDQIVDSAWLWYNRDV